MTECAIVGCGRKRGTRKGDIERTMFAWLCHAHWIAVPSTLRRRHGKVQRAARRTPSPVMQRLSATLWERCWEAAVLAAGGNG